MVCRIVDDDHAVIHTDPTADRIAQLEANIDRQDRDIIALRALLMSVGVRQAGMAAAQMQAKGDQLNHDQEEAVRALVPDVNLTRIRFANESCIVANAGRMGSLKITRRGMLTIGKFKQDPVKTDVLDLATRSTLFP
jgi:hypothetical protein